MCTRFYIERSSDDYKEHTALIDRFYGIYSKGIITFGEVRPTDVVPVIAPDKDGLRSTFPMKWGYTLPNTNKPLVNARVETAPTKPTFKESWARHRCIIPAAWYYEWDHFKSADGKTKNGDKYLIQPANSNITCLCGLYRIEKDIPVFTVLTTTPTKELSIIHDRMPLILPEEYIDKWIDPNSKADDILQYALTDMIIEKAKD